MPPAAQIYNEKHNGNTVAPNEVDNREANQQQRTANGLRSGQMTSGEAARTNRNQSNLAQQVHNERTANGGALTPQRRSRPTSRRTRTANRSTTRSTTTKPQNQKGNSGCSKEMLVGQRKHLLFFSERTNTERLAPMPAVLFDPEA